MLPWRDDYSWQMSPHSMLVIPSADNTPEHTNQQSPSTASKGFAAHHNSLTITLEEHPLVTHPYAAQPFPMSSEVAEHGKPSSGELTTRRFGIDGHCFDTGHQKGDYQKGITVGKPQTLTQRNLYYQALSNNVGFTITDPSVSRVRHVY